MARVAGIDGTGPLWVAAIRSRDIVSWRVGHTSEIIALALDCDMVAIDIPIGFVESGMRAAEAEARTILGGAARSIFPTPPAPAMLVGRREGTSRATRPMAQEASRRAGGVGISTQSWGIASKILDVEDALADLPVAPASRVVETHPETAFRVMARAAASGGIGPTSRAARSFPSKLSAAGVARRLDALGVDISSLDDPALERVPIDDALDALAAAWTAGRILRDEADLLGGRDAYRSVWSDGTRAPGRAVIWV